MSKSKIFLALLLAFLGAVFWRSFFEIAGGWIFLLLIFALILLFVFYKNKQATLVAFLLVFFVFGLWLTDKRINEANNLKFVGQTFEEKAVVQKVSASAFGQNVIAQLEKEKISVLLQVPQYPQYQYGDVLEIACAAKAIENKDESFDYRMYLAKEGVLYQCEKSKARKVGEGSGNWLFGKILAMRSVFESKINQVIPQPEGALAVGILLGGSGGFSKEIQADFSRTGMTHIVAVSGYNVTIVAEYLILLGIFLGLWRKQAIWFAFFGIAAFVVMAGLPASAVRAGVMSGVLLWAMKNGRLASCENAIIFAGAIMLALNPLLLRWDVGFQLSFLATLGIVLTSSFWEEKFVKENKALGISEAITLSLSAQIFVLPIIAYNFQIVSLISLLANVFILPVIPLSMLLVFLVTLAGLIFPPLSLVFAWLAYSLLTWEINLIRILAQFPWASVSVEKVSVWWIVIYYII
ncbi:MAG: ComEC/Rec2 family competence protein, partial [Candidatus Moraniibacteriota bacterium]